VSGRATSPPLPLLTEFLKNSPQVSDRIPGRYALDTPLFRSDVFVARYDKRLGVRSHCTEDGAHMLSHNVGA